MRIFFDLNVHAYPENEVMPEELLRIAKKYGYAGLAITNHDDSVKETSDLPPSVSNSNFIFRGVEIRARSAWELKRKIKDYREKVDILAVHGGDEKINRAALKDPRVDILAHPFDGEGKLNHILAKYAAENGIAIEININAIIHSRRSGRARILQKMRESLKLTRKYATKMVITSNAQSIYDIRAPRDMVALASLFGMRREEALCALSDVPKGIIEKKWKREKEVEIIS